MHSLILGITTSGKTTLATHLVTEYKSKGYPVFVLDPLMDKRWEQSGADLVTHNPKRFLHSAEQSRGCMLFIDESGETIGKYNDEMFWLATRARHNGHISHFICQRFAQVSRTVRDQCAHLFCFKQSFYDANQLSIDWANTQLLEVAKLQKYEFIYCSRFGGIEKMTTTLDGVVKNARSRSFDSADTTYLYRQ